MAEHLALAEQVHRTFSIHQLDGSSPDHADLALGLHALGQYLSVGGKELDLGPAGELLQVASSSPLKGSCPAGTRDVASVSEGESRRRVQPESAAAARSTVG